MKSLWWRSSTAPGLTCAAWVALAFASLTHTAWVSWIFGMEGASDLHAVRAWLHEWNLGAGNPYLRPDLEADYPPHAFFLLWPLLRPGETAAAHLVLGANLVLSVAAAWLLVRWISDLAGVAVSRAEAVTLAAMVLSSNAVRISLILGQLAPLAFVLFLLSTRLARRPGIAGACFGLASLKVNLAASFAIILAMRRRYAALAIAAVVVVAGAWLVAASLRSSLTVVIADYMNAVVSAYHREPEALGVTSVWTLISPRVPAWSSLQAALALGTLGVLIVLARRAGDAPSTRAIVAVGCLLWSLATLPHQRYNVGLLLPALWLLQWPGCSFIRRDWLKWTICAAGLIVVTGTVPLFVEARFDLARAAWPQGLASVCDAGVRAFEHGPAVLAVGLFAACLAELRRRAQGAN